MLLISSFITLSVVNGWKLTFFEDFSGSELNSSIWNIRDHESHCCPAEDELYMSYNVAIDTTNHHLVITTQREEITYDNITYHFTSGWIDTKEKWYQTYGKFEVNASLPERACTGAWPAHWLMPNPSTAIPPNVCWPVGGEIDIMEYTSFVKQGFNLTNRIAGSYRWGTKCDRDKQLLPGAMYPPARNSTLMKTWDQNEFHLYSVEWDADHLSFFVDNNLYETKTNKTVDLPQENPFYWILNTGVAYYRPPTKESKYPAYHIIDYVKVYQYD